MPFFHNFIVFLTLVASVRLDDIDPTPAPVKAKATLTLGELRLFSGEDLQMTCSVPDDPLADWTYRWSYEGELVGTTEVYSLNKARVQQSGSYTCQGEKPIESWPYIVSSAPSDPLTIYVDGGWVLLRTPIEPLIIEETTTLTCRVRNNPILSEVVIYKAEELISKQKDKDLVLTNLKIEDNGMYSCRATWFKNQEYQSAQSLPSTLTILEKLETPKMEFLTGRSKIRSGNKVVFKCITKVNAREKDLSPEYYYLKDGNRLGRASAKDTYTISEVSKDDSGSYTCRVRVRALDVEKSSEKLDLKVLPPLNL